MSWIQTYPTCQQFDVTLVDSEKIDIRDIAHALSMQCRFGGHCAWHYSIAQHSLYVARRFDNLHLRRYALLHDASEAYLVDVPRPIKNLDGMYAYRQMERLLQGKIYQKFGLGGGHVPQDVQLVDNLMLMTERRDLKGPVPAPWTADLEALEPYKWHIQQWPIEQAHEEFLGEFSRLFPEFAVE